MNAVNIVLYSLLNGKKTAVNPVTVGEQVLLADGTNLPQALDNLLAVAIGASLTRVVPGIPARDILPGKHTGLQVWVVDATGDPSVKSGSAKYLWIQEINEGAGAWLKTAESESMDVIVQWAAIHGIPQVLKMLDMDGYGRLTCNGETVNDGKRDVAIVDAAQPIPGNMREGGLVLLKALSGDDLVPQQIVNGTPVSIVPSLRGPAGHDGQQGVQGEQGPQGLQGIKGTDGTNGIDGQKGDKGDKGDPGPTGATGPQGVPGAVGPQGARGSQGPPGADGTLLPLATAAVAGKVFLPQSALNGTAAAAPAGYGLGTTSPAISDCNEALHNGWYDGANMLNAPSGGWYTILVAAHSNGAHWRYQLAFGYAGAAGIWWRQCNGGTWTGWQSLNPDVALAVSPAGTRGVVAAYTNYAVPAYLVGAGRLQVWLDGILCAGGGNAAQHTYQEVGAAGAWSGHIRFHQQIDNTYEITVRVR